MHCSRSHRAVNKYAASCRGNSAAHLALGGLQVTGVNPPAESLWDAWHSSVGFVKALDVLFWNILAPKAGQHR